MRKKRGRKKVITICTSASFYKEALAIGQRLRLLDYRVRIPSTAYVMRKRKNFNVKDYKTWYQDKTHYKKKTALIEGHFKKIVDGNAILVVNLKKNGIAGYIGGNTLMEMAIAFQFQKPIFVLYPIYENSPFQEEIFGMEPIFLDGDLNKILNLKM